MPQEYSIKYKPSSKEVVICVDTNSDCENVQPVPTPAPFDGNAERARQAAASSASIAATAAAAANAAAAGTGTAGTGSVSPSSLQFNGGNSNYFYEKYMKYKAKYLQLKRNN